MLIRPFAVVAAIVVVADGRTGGDAPGTVTGGNVVRDGRKRGTTVGDDIRCERDGTKTCSVSMSVCAKLMRCKSADDAAPPAAVTASMTRALDANSYTPGRNTAPVTCTFTVDGAGATVGAMTAAPAPDTRGTADSSGGPDGRTSSQLTTRTHAPTRKPMRRRRGPTKATQWRRRSRISVQSGNSMAPMWTFALERRNPRQVVLSA